MWQFARYLVLLALVISGEASPKRYHGLSYKSSNVKVTNERLSTDVLPTNYEIKLTVLEENLQSGKFSGEVTIGIVAQVDNVKSFNIHAKLLDIKSVTLEDLSVEKTTHEETDLLEITLNKVLEKNKMYNLIIEYDGILSDTDMEGLYRSSYVQDKEVVYLATTQFEQMGARRAFPCFDEPAIKATFSVIVSHSNEYKVLSNTNPKTTTKETDITVTTFEPTPEMSTYLVAFIISKFNCATGDTTADGIPTEVCARKDAQNTLNVALETAPKALNAMATYTNLKYSVLGNKKMTQAAIPDFAAGAMENWGLVTYRESDLLIDEKESSNYYKQIAVTVVTHEFAHQWFGDYITLDWWSDVFLNEGFATYFEYHAASQIQPDWELEKQFVVEQIQPVLYTDSMGNTEALHSDPQNSDEIEGKFDDISYNKGGSILRMLQHFLSLDNFKTGLTTYLKTGPIGTPENLWKSFDSAISNIKTKPKLPDDVSVAQIMDTWTNKPGYPLLNVVMNDPDLVVITQKRFLPSVDDEKTKSTDTDEDTQWYVPITYTTSKQPTTDNTETQEWLVPSGNVTISITDLDWIVLNKQQVGYYRVNYDSTLLNKIKNALDKNVTSIDEISRSQLVDDQLNLARLGYKKYNDVLEFLKFLKNDESYYSWYPAFTGFTYLLKRTDSDDVKTQIKSYITKLMDKLHESVDNKDVTKQVDYLKKELAQKWACNLDFESCISEAKDAFNKTTNSQESVDPNERSYVYCTALRTADNATEVYSFLWDRYLATDLSTEKVTILKALGCTTDSSIRTKYLNEALGNDVRIQDVRYVFQSVYTNGGINEVFELIANNYTAFTTRFGSTSTANNLIATVADYITNNEQLDSLKTIPDKVAGDDKATVKEIVDNVEIQVNTNIKTIKDLEENLKQFFDQDTNAGGINSYHFVNLALAAVVYFLFNL